MMANVKKALANKGFVVGGCIFLAIALIALVGPLVWTVNPNAQEMALRLSAPSPAHPFGCDDFGRDLACPRHRGRARGRLALALPSRSRRVCSAW